MRQRPVRCFIGLDVGRRGVRKVGSEGSEVCRIQGDVSGSVRSFGVVSGSVRALAVETKDVCCCSGVCSAKSGLGILSYQRLASEFLLKLGVTKRLSCSLVHFGAICEIRLILEQVRWDGRSDM